MKREFILSNITTNPNKIWDIIIIGGGATGLGTAVDAASRGYSTILFEQADFAKGTSSRSTKLVHGGVRYLAKGDISLVFEALRERGLLKQNAPHLVKDQQFIIPIYDWWDGPFYNIGMKVYDMMAGKLGIGPSQKISKEETMKAIPNLTEEGLDGGIIYYDGQFDDSRLAINLAQTAFENGASLLNYAQVTALTKDYNGIVNGVEILDVLNDEIYNIHAKVIVNATGVFVDSICKMDNTKAMSMVKPSQGVHIVLDKSFLRGNSAIMIPKTSDGRVLFAVPWHNKVIIGTTDTEVNSTTLEPRALEDEIKFLLETSARYLKKAPSSRDVLSIFAGLRPLAAPENSGDETKEISRSHKIVVSLSGMITVVGGKWTTYRKMAEDIVEKAIIIGGLEDKDCQTKTMPIHGYVKNVNFNEPLYYYGADKVKIEELIKNSKNDLTEQLHPRLPYITAEVIWAVRHEMALTVEDFLARRVRALFLDAPASIEMAPKVAKIMAKELGRNRRWIREQISDYTDLAQGYLLHD